MNEHKVVDEFTVKSKRVIIINNKRSFEELETKKIVVDGKSYPYELTHNEFIFVVDTTESLLGKTISFNG